MDGLLETWTATLRAQSPHTARAYEAAVRRFLEATGKDVSELTVGDAARYLATLSTSGLSRASIAHHISAIRSFLRYAQSLGIIPQSPLDALKRPSVTITSMNRYLNKAEAEALLRGAEAVGPSCYLAVALMLGTGLRVSEAANAQWRHLFRDPQGRLGLLVLGKGAKERVVAIRDDLWSLLVADRKRRGLPTNLDARDKTPLLATARGEAPTPMTLWRWVRAAAEAAGLDKAPSPHWLRHTFGTLAATSGASVFAIQQDMGHAQITTSQRYIHWAKGLEGSAAYALDLDLGPKG